ncbi:MAG: hypothetical protein WCD70_11415 [Alphaproteobacteria bacterium]
MDGADLSLANLALIGAVKLNSKEGIDKALAAGATVNIVFTGDRGYDLSLLDICLYEALARHVPDMEDTVEYLKSKGALSGRKLTPAPTLGAQTHNPKFTP